MKRNPLVSVLINNYNKEKYCLDSVRSVLNQSYKNFEIIFFDDCSNDHSIKKLKSQKNFIKRMKLILNKKRGKIFSFNQINSIKKSVNKSKGEIICFLDSDDFFKKNKLNKVVNFFKDNEDQDILFDIPIFYKNRYESFADKAENYFFRKNKWPKFPSTSCISLKKKSFYLIDSKVFKNKFHELWFDFRVATYFALKKKQFNVINENLTYYRQYDSSYDKKYNKYLNSSWWKRRNEAFEFVDFICGEKFSKLHTRGPDFFLTKLVNFFL